MVNELVRIAPYAVASMLVRVGQYPEAPSPAVRPQPPNPPEVAPALPSPCRADAATSHNLPELCERGGPASRGLDIKVMSTSGGKRTAGTQDPAPTG